MADQKIYKYEMHMHTCPCSGGGVDIREHIDALIKKGYSGAVVTNHFYNGDNRIDRSLPWAEFVDFYRQDYLLGLQYAQKLDFDLLFGLEEHISDGRELLIYGITPDFLDLHPELKMASAEVYASVVHAAGGVLYQAHPYRAKSYINKPFPFECLHLLDGIEVCNAGNLPEWDEKAKALADELGLATIAGSDAHSSENAGRAGIAARERIRNNEALVRILKSGAYTIFRNA